MSLSRSALRVMSELERLGFLLLQDAKLPNLAALVAGAPISGSWWGHPAGHAIFGVAGEIDAHPDVMVTKLCAGKVTFVHRRFFGALIAIGRAREPWQLRGLSSAARRLLERVDREKVATAKGPAAKDLEKRLLVASREVHTDSGAHAIELVEWSRFARERRVKVEKLGTDSAKKRVETALAAIEAESSARAKLPWPFTRA
jgi:hypothetical protein